jgi:FkbM family methyltransferase
MDQLSRVYLRNHEINFLKKDRIIGRGLQNGHYWEEWMLKYIKKYYRQGTDMLDIGANIGTTSLLMSEVITRGNKIHSFEPLFDDILQTNITNNKKGSVIQLYRCALGEDNYLVNRPAINRSIENNFGATIIAYFHNGQRDEHPESVEKISVKKLDDFNLSNVGLIKIDVEGYEMNVLKGAVSTLVKNKYPPILIEIWEIGRWSTNKEICDFYINRRKEIIQYLNKLGYVVTHIAEDDFICVHQSRNI